MKMVRMASYECGVIRFILGLCWFLLVCVGFCWFMLGLCWFVLVFVGFCWFGAGHYIQEWNPR